MNSNTSKKGRTLLDSTRDMQMDGKKKEPQTVLVHDFRQVYKFTINLHFSRFQDLHHWLFIHNYNKKKYNNV